MNNDIDSLTKMINENENDAELYFKRGYLYENQNDHEKAISDYNKAIELNSEYAEAYNNRGILYSDLNNYEKAISDYNKAIELNSEYAEAYNNRGILYSDLKNYEKALSDYNKAIELKDEYAIAYSNRGVLYHRQKDYEKALSDYNKAIELNIEFANAYRNRAFAFYLCKDYEKALSDYETSKKLYSANNNTSGERFVTNKINELNGILAGRNLLKDPKEAIENEIGWDEDTIQKLLAQTDLLDNDIQEMKKSFNDFLTEDNKKTSEVPEFEVLRRWNSYTPIIADDYRISKGGGYFCKAGDCGIVIDPGFNFISNFKSAGHIFNEIDYVLITHAHNDHTTDLESILTLLHKYNENIIGDFDNPEENTIMYKVINEFGRKPEDKDKKQLEEKAKELFLEDRRRKRISICMTASTYKKYASMLSLYSKSDYDIRIIKDGDKIPLDYPGTFKKDNYADGLSIKAIYSKHDDLMSDQDSVGFVIEHENLFLVYTGDTGYDHIVESVYIKIKADAGNKDIILLAHLGGFKSREAEFMKDKSTKENSKAFYKNHLGRLGIAKLVQILAPKICIISEFGEEFRRTRLEIIKIYNELYKGTIFFASDITFSINADRKVKAITSLNDIDKREYIEPDRVLTCERRADYSLHYYYKKDGLRESDIIEALVTQYFLKRT